MRSRKDHIGYLVVISKRVGDPPSHDLAMGMVSEYTIVRFYDVVTDSCLLDSWFTVWTPG